jgi:hypothetical protein
VDNPVPDTWWIEADPHEAVLWVRDNDGTKRRPTEAEACAIQRYLRDRSPVPEAWKWPLPGVCAKYG